MKDDGIDYSEKEEQKMTLLFGYDCKDRKEQTSGNYCKE